MGHRRAAAPSLDDERDRCAGFLP